MREFARFGVEAAYFVPTTTGLTKSIIDAHESVRRFLSKHQVHDFDRQPQGQGHKVVKDIDIVMRDHLDIRTISLYRPETKTGDPRLWISRLGDVAAPGNLLALFVSTRGRLTLVNCSDTAVWPPRDSSAVEEVLAVAPTGGAADDLLRKLRAICRLGWVRSLRDGPTGVGFTLESQLGIRANSSKNPDYRGIEIKSSRMRAPGRSETRTTLFSKTPAWAMSSLKNGSDVLSAHGYHDPTTGRLQLYCSLSNTPNTQGLYLRTGSSGPDVGMHSTTGGPWLVWRISDLESALAAKHRETFWVSARQRQTSDGTEEFRYEKVVHTRSPLIANVGPLIEAGKIEMDLTLSLKASGGIRDHGYLFKIWRKDLDLLFPPPMLYDLTGQDA